MTRTMGWKSIAVTCALLAGHATASVDVSALRNPDSWPSPGAPGPGRLTVDLGYAIYQGYSNTSTGVDVWKGYVHCTDYLRIVKSSPA